MLFNAWLSFNSCLSLKAEAIEASHTVIVCVNYRAEANYIAARQRPQGIRMVFVMMHDGADPSYLMSYVMIDSSHGSSLPSAFPQERVYTPLRETSQS